MNKSPQPNNELTGPRNGRRQQRDWATVTTVCDEIESWWRGMMSLSMMMMICLVAMTHSNKTVTLLRAVNRSRSFHHQRGNQRNMPAYNPPHGRKTQDSIFRFACGFRDATNPPHSCRWVDGEENR